MTNEGDVPGEPFIEPPAEPTIVPMSDDPPAPGEPTQVMPATPPPAGDPTLAAPTAAAAAAAAAAGANPPGGPPTAPVYANAPDDEPWYRDPRGRAAMVGAGLAALLILIVALVWWGGGDEDEVVVGTSSSTSVASSLPPSTSAAPVTTAPPTTGATTAPPTTAPPTTAPPTTEATTTTTTVAPTTTVAATTTTVAPTTTVAATTTTTLPGPVVTPAPNPDATLLDVVQGNPDLSRVNELIQFSGFAAELDADEPRTFFAPTNDAIDAFEATAFGQAVLADADATRDLLAGHLALESLSAAQLSALPQLEMASGDVLAIDGTAGTIDGADLLVVDVTAANGRLHVVSAVLGN